MDVITTKYPFSAVCDSHIGGRTENQDVYAWAETPLGVLFVVCDGMGGGPSGRLASTIASETFVSAVKEAKAGSDRRTIITDAIHSAHRAILETISHRPECQGMGTTIVAVLISEDSALIVHVGDSRFYQIRNGSKIFRTHDHSVVAMAVDQGLMTEDEARCAKNSNIITRAIGIEGICIPDIDERYYKKGDLFLLCSDGIWGSMSESELLAMLCRPINLRRRVCDLVDKVNMIGISKGNKHDNLTAIIIEAEATSKGRTIWGLLKRLLKRLVRIIKRK